MSNVIALPGNSTGEVNAELVEELERLLADAKSGAIVAGAWVATLADGLCLTGWSAGGSRYALAPGILVLQWRYAEACCK